MVKFVETDEAPGLEEQCKLVMSFAIKTLDDAPEREMAPVREAAIKSGGRSERSVFTVEETGMGVHDINLIVAFGERSDWSRFKSLIDRIATRIDRLGNYIIQDMNLRAGDPEKIASARI